MITSLRVSTDLEQIGAVLDAVVADDPVRNTVLGTVRLGLTDSAWAAWHVEPDGRIAGLAARSEADYPLAIVGRWDVNLRTALIDALRAVDDLIGLSGSEADAEAVVTALGRPPIHRERQRLFRLDELITPTVPGAPLRAGDVHRHLARDWYAAFGEEVHDIGADLRMLADRMIDSGQCWLWVDPDGTPVALAARRPVVAGSARIGPVYTPPAQRGHGWGSALTAAVAATILDEGAVPVLFTDLDNPTSNKIYRAIGFRPVQDRVVVMLGS